NLVRGAETWRWGSLWDRVHSTAERWLHAWPVPMPFGWASYVNRPQSELELASLPGAVMRGSPFGDEGWRLATAEKLRQQSPLRPPGPPQQLAGGLWKKTPDPLALPTPRSPAARFSRPLGTKRGRRCNW